MSTIYGNPLLLLGNKYQEMFRELYSTSSFHY